MSNSMEREYHKLLEHLDCDMETASPCGRVFVRSSGAGITLHLKSPSFPNNTIIVECLKCREILIRIDKPAPTGIASAR
jgi:hypothetical protein